ncbi:MAG: hypothetical protein DMG92_00130 [Acidobacteria bacterium]|nr:MAG: hypothetical protein DMG92_00130 [Acidobacteriota bacterium]
MSSSTPTPPPPADSSSSVTQKNEVGQGQSQQTQIQQTQPNQPTDFDIGEEYGTARKNLPPAGILAICIAVVLVIVAAYSMTHRAHALSSGTIDDVVSIAVPDQNMVMVAINVTVHNNSDKPSWIHTIQASLDSGGKTNSDDAAPAVDAQRYFQAFPDLKQHALPFLTTETRLNSGSKTSGTIVVSFPVKADEFAARKSLTVTIAPYDEVPVVIKKQ